MKIFFSIFFFVIGSVFGSFSNMLIYRIPRGISIIFPFSFCPSCKSKIKFYDNIPIISYIILRGKCRSCKVKIPLRYFIVEVLMAFLFLFSYLKFNISLNLLKILIFIFISITISFIDIENMIIPDILSIPGIILGFLFSLLSQNFFNFLFGGLLGAFIPFIFYIIGKIIKKELMGEGDIMVLSMVGIYTGWENVIITLFIASFLGSIIGIILKIKSKTKYLPFAPFLYFSAFLTFFYDFSTFFSYIFFKSNLK